MEFSRLSFAAFEKDKRERLPPISLTGKNPVAELVINFLLSPSFFYKILDYIESNVIPAPTLKLLRFEKYAVLFAVEFIKRQNPRLLFGVTFGYQNRVKRDVILLRECEVAFVVRATVHYTRSVIGNGIGSHPNRNILSGRLIGEVSSGKDSFHLLEMVEAPFCFSVHNFLGELKHRLLKLGSGNKLRKKRVLRRDDRESLCHEGLRNRVVHRNL